MRPFALLSGCFLLLPAEPVCVVRFEVSNCNQIPLFNARLTNLIIPPAHLQVGAEIVLADRSQVRFPYT